MKHVNSRSKQFTTNANEEIISTLDCWDATKIFKGGKDTSTREDTNIGKKIMEEDIIHVFTHATKK